MNKDTKRLLIQIGLFILTVISTTLSGAEWRYGGLFLYAPETLGWDEFVGGFAFSIPFLGILTIHEFGHYLTARYYKVKVTLPYYIPAWFGIIGSPSIGTFGALIQLKEKVKSLKVTFDIGIAGPLAGFVAALFVVFIGFTNLPPAETIYEIHPEYQLFGKDYANVVYDKDTFFLRSDLAKINQEAAARYEADTVRIGPSYQLGLVMGSNLVFDFAKEFIVPENHKDRIPSPHEMIHYPWLFAGFLALLFTAINLLPIGQLDGGHVLYGLLGSDNSRKVAAVFFISLIVFSGLNTGLIGVYNPFDLSQSLVDIIIDLLVYGFFVYYVIGRMEFSRMNRITITLGIIALQEIILIMIPGVSGYGGWMLFTFIIGRYIGVYHPKVEKEEPLDSTRVILGWLALIVFIICFSFQPIQIG